MGAQLRVFRRRIRSVQATKKITKAMELIASSRIVKAQQQVQASEPLRARVAPGRRPGGLAHQGQPPADREGSSAERAAMLLLITADRGLAGAYSVNAIKEGEQLTELMRNEKKMEVVPFICRPQGPGLLQVPRAPGRRLVDRLHRCADLRGCQADREGSARPLPFMKTEGRWRRRDPHRLSTPATSTGSPGGAGCPHPATGGRRGRGHLESNITGGADAGGTPVWPLYDFRAEPRRGARRAAAQVRGVPRVRRAPAVSGLRARGPATEP